MGGERERLNVGKKSIVHTGWIRLGRFLSQNTKDFFNENKKNRNKIVLMQMIRNISVSRNSRNANVIKSNIYYMARAI